MNDVERRKGGDRRRLTGAQRAAALLIVLGKEAAPRLLQHLDKDEVREIARAAATLGIVDRTSLDRMIDQFADDFAEGPDVVGTISEARELVAGSLEPQELAEIAGSEMQEPKVDVWAQLASQPDEWLSGLLVTEDSCVAAAILDKLGTERAAGLLDQLDETRRPEIVARMLLARSATPLAAQLLEQSISTVLGSAGKSQGGGEARKRIADIVNRLDSRAADEVVAYLSDVAPEDAKAIRGLVFKFDEVGALSQPDRVTLFDGLPTERVVLALKGAQPDLVESVLGCLGARARRMAESELASDSPAPTREVQAARRMVVDAALRLSASGAIVLPAAATSE